MSLYLGNNLISGTKTVTDNSERIGQIITSTIPLTDAGLHPLDGALISGSGAYADFVDYIADLYSNSEILFAYRGGSSETGGVVTYYTKTTTLTAGMSLYDENGNVVSTLYDSSTSYSPRLSSDGTGIVVRTSNGGMSFNISLSYNQDYNVGSGVFCGENVWQTAVTNYGSCPCYVYNSTNNTVRLPKYTSEHGKLIKSNSSGTDWYRIYEDGWCEQGGTTSLVTSDTDNIQINFNRSFINTNYQFIASSHYAGSLSPSTGNVNHNQLRSCSVLISDNNAKTTSSINITRLQADNYDYWYAYGYTDISDYQYSPIYEYVVLATSTKTDIEVDIDEIATDLNGKADVDLTNTVPTHAFATALNSATIRTVVETYHSGSNWYRVWSDGFIEQGGVKSASTGDSTQVSLNTNFSGTGYFVIASEYSAVTGTSNTTNRNIARIVGKIVSTSTNSFVMQTTTSDYYWYACGF